MASAIPKDKINDIQKYMISMLHHVDVLESNFLFEEGTDLFSSSTSSVSSAISPCFPMSPLATPFGRKILV